MDNRRIAEKIRPTNSGGIMKYIVVSLVGEIVARFDTEK